MAEQKPARNDLLLQTLARELAFFDAGGYGRPSRRGWRPTLLLRDSKSCMNYNATGRQTSCHECAFFAMVPASAQNAIVPCHQIALDARGNTIASMYEKNTQKELDEHYREWLSALIQKTQQH